MNDELEQAFRQGYERGKEKAKDLLRAAIVYISAKDDSSEMSEWLNKVSDFFYGGD